MHRPKQTPAPTQPDTSALNNLLQAGSSVTVTRLALAATYAYPIDDLALWLWEGPLGDTFRCGPVTVLNFATQEDRDSYIRLLNLHGVVALSPDKQRLIERFIGTTDAVSVLQAIHSALVADFVLDTIKGRLLDGLFIESNRGAGRGWGEALHAVTYGDSVEQREALLQILKAFGEEFLVDHSFPIIGQRYHEHTRTNRTFTKEARAALTTAFKRTYKASDPRRTLILALALNQELVREHFDGNLTGKQLMDTIIALRGQVYWDESAKVFAQFVRRTFEARKDVRAA